MKRLVENLKEIGFNSYEAKVYLALLKKYPATGYEVSQIADIPQARAYDTLKSLEKELIVTVDNSKPAKYMPIKPSELTKRFKRKINSTIDFLDKNLPKVKDDYNEPILCLIGADNIYQKAIELIKESKEELYMELWPKEFNLLEPYLLDAYNRGVEIKIVGYDNLKSNFGTIFEHEGTKAVEHYIEGKMIVIVADSKEALVGHLNYNNLSNTNSIWTKNQAIVLFIKEFVIHDMYLIDIEENLSDQMKIVYGKNMTMLKEKIFGAKIRSKIH